MAEAKSRSAELEARVNILEERLASERDRSSETILTLQEVCL